MVIVRVVVRIPLHDLNTFKHCTHNDLELTDFLLNLENLDFNGPY